MSEMGGLPAAQLRGWFVTGGSACSWVMKKNRAAMDACYGYLFLVSAVSVLPPVCPAQGTFHLQIVGRLG